MNFAIGILSFRRGNLTERCISSVRKHTQNKYHIFLADNGSNDRETLEIIARYESSADITLIRLDRNYGPSKGRNFILEKIDNTFDAIAMLDNDAYVMEGWDVAAVKGFEFGFHMIQPLLVETDGETVERGPNTAANNEFQAGPKYIGAGLRVGSPEVNQIRNVETVGGTGIYLFEVFQEIGNYNANLCVNEDYDYSYRAKSAGFRLGYIPSCMMVHDHVVDVDYDNERGDPRRLLLTHIEMWQSHRKCVYSPFYMNWFLWLALNKQPMLMPMKVKWQSIPIRLIRRLARRWYTLRYRNHWVTSSEAKAGVDKLIRLLN